MSDSGFVFRRAKRGWCERGLAVVLMGITLGFAGAAFGQDAATAAADRAEAAVEEVRALLEALESEVEATSEAEPPTERRGANGEGGGGEAGASESAGDPVRAASPTAAGEETAEAPVPDPVERAVERAEAAAEQAEDAAWEARQIAAAVEAELTAYRDRYARTGPYLGGGVALGFEDFDAQGFDSDDSRGFAAWLGYRVHRHVAVELRGEVFEGFGVRNKSSSSLLAEGEVEAYAITLNARVYPFTGSIQPYAGLGIGAMHADLDGTRFDATRVSQSATEPVIRPSAGVDVYLSENLVLNLEGTYLSPGGDLDGLDVGAVSAGLTFRF